MTPAEALVRALEREAVDVCQFCDRADPAGGCRCAPCSSARAVDAFHTWLANESVEAVAKAMYCHDDGRKDPWPWEETTDMTQTPYRGRARAALRAIFGELAP